LKFQAIDIYKAYGTEDILKGILLEAASGGDYPIIGARSSGKNILYAVQFFEHSNAGMNAF